MSFIFRVALVVLLVLLSLHPMLVVTPVWAPWWVVGLQLGAASLLWLLLWYWATSLKLFVQFQAFIPPQEKFQLCLLELVRFLMVLLAVWAFLIVHPHLPDIFTRAMAAAVPPLLLLTIYTLVGLLTIYALALVLAMLVRGLEFSDRRRFASAKDIIAMPLDSVYEREEGGVNRYQNHLASMTYVKPGGLED